MRVRLIKERGLYMKRGLGLYISYGDLGTEYGDNRPKLFFDIEAVIIWWTFNLGFYWRKGKNTWDQMILEKRKGASHVVVRTTHPRDTSSGSTQG